MTDMRCENCHTDVPGYDVTHLGSCETGYRDLCSRCYNAEITQLCGSGFEHVSFEPIAIADLAGRQRTFHFLLRHLGNRVSLDAFEVAEGVRAGYQFQVVDAAEADLFDLMRRLVERVRRTLATRYLVDEESGTTINGTKVGGRIDCDLDTYPSLPTLVIDGRDVSWSEFGRMVMTFEGWQFQLTFKDPSEEQAAPAVLSARP
jgi:hypothetical protein